MPAAARHFDETEHSNALAGLLIGIGAGLVVGALIVASGGTAALIIAGSFAAKGAIGVAIGASVGAGVLGAAGRWLGGLTKSRSGPICVMTGPTVLINGRVAARVGDGVTCTRHHIKSIAQGSKTVWIVLLPAARVDDRTVCDSIIKAGSPDVLIGGGQETYLRIEPEIPLIAEAFYLIVSLPGMIAGIVDLAILGAQLVRSGYQLWRARGLMTVFRVEGLPNTRILIDAHGNISILDKGKALWLNFGQKDRALAYLAQKLEKGLPGAELKSFQVPKSFLEKMRGIAVPEELAKVFPNSPVIGDATKAIDQLGLRPDQIEELLKVIELGSGKVH